MQYGLLMLGTRDEILALLNSTALTGITVLNANPGMTPTHTDEENGPTNTNAPAFDSAGLPWDDRIHAKTKAQTADGTWRKRRNIDASLVAQVEAELKARGATNMYMPQPNGGAPQITPPTAQVPQPAPPQQYQPQPAPPQYQQPVPPQTVAQYQQPAPPYQPPPAPVVAQSPPAPGLQRVDFNGFMQQITHKMQQPGGPDAVYFGGLVQQLSQMFQRPLSAITDIANDPNLINAAQDIMISNGKWY